MVSGNRDVGRLLRSGFPLETPDAGATLAGVCRWRSHRSGSRERVSGDVHKLDPISCETVRADLIDGPPPPAPALGAAGWEAVPRSHALEAARHVWSRTAQPARVYHLERVVAIADRVGPVYRRCPSRCGRRGPQGGVNAIPGTCRSEAGSSTRSGCSW